MVPMPKPKKRWIAPRFLPLGVIVRDHNGFFLASKAQRWVGVADILQIEAQTVLEGFSFAMSQCYNKVITND